MADTATGFVGLVIEIVRWVGAPIIRQVNYLRCFTTNIASLQVRGQELENAAAGLQGQVDRERENVQVIVAEVETWIKRFNEIKDLKNTILAEVPNVESGCLKLRARYSLSKRAKKTTDRIIEHLGEKQFNAIAQPGPPAARMAIPLGMNTCRFESRKQIEEEIMKSLRDGERNMIGICGMGGLGKTTMAKIIKKRALEEHVFEEVVMIVVSQPVDKLKIQVEIGGPLNLNLEGETSEVRVQKLHARLTTEDTKRILLVLDDVWERLELHDLGIPCGPKGCTILLTSRNRHVLNAMDVQKENIFGMEILSEEDSWFLFRERAGTCVDDTQLNSIVKQVVEKCRGLPIALSTLGSALKGETNGRIWKDALRQLRKANPTNIPDFIKEVYNPLKVSYEKLDSQEAKSVFLLCCLFGEDANIPVENLTYFCMGLSIFEAGISNLEEARNGMSALIKMLKSRSLLLDGLRDEDCVQMHDVVRDVCKFIAKQEGYIGGNDCTWISSFQTTVGERIKLPTNLHLLFLSCNYSEQEEETNKFDNSFVEKIRNLQVLFIEYYSSFASLLPHTTESLRNLKTLVLNSCWRLETISFVGELVHLEILVCHHCYSIKELPPEMKRLNTLKLLDLSRCENLERIDGGIISSLVGLEELMMYGCHSIKELPPEMKRLNRMKLLDVSECRNLERISPGIISSLVGLEELKMLESFKKWDSNERENGNATIRELEALTNLRCLEIEIDPALAAENMRLPSKLDRFQIRIPPVNLRRGMREDSYQRYEFSSYSNNKKMSLKWEGETCVGEWIEMQLIRDAECLYLTGNGSNNVDLAKSENIRWLELEKCETMKNIVRTSMDDATVFPHMEYLRLFALRQLEEILDGSISSNSFHNLKELELEHLPALKKVWKSNSSPVFHNLSSIRIVNCPKLEEILDGPISSDSFHNLKELELEDLPALKQLWKSSTSPVLHNLSSIDIFNCRCLRNLGQLSSIAENNCLSQLQFLTVKDCEMMEQVFLWNEEDERRATKIMFPKLKEVELYNLPNLVTLCQGIGSIEFPLLTRMEIQICPKMKSMVSSEENNCGGSRNADIDDYHSPHLFCQPQNVSFDSLKILTVKGNAFYCQKIPTSFFNGLEELTVWGYEGSMSLFTSSIAQNFVSLRELSIKKCNEIVEVIKDEEAVNGGERPHLFPKLEELELIDLCKLESFCEWNCDVKCRRLFISSCSNMKIFNLGSDVSFSFHGLEDLKIQIYEGGLMSLFSSSIAQKLVNLIKLELYICHHIVKVIEDEKEEENVVSGGAQTTTTILFPKLQKLRLACLDKLESFCEWKCDVKLPSLRKVKIKWCSNMKIFTRGHLITPNLESVKIETLCPDTFFCHKYLESGEKDLNGTLEQHYLAREKKKQKEEEAYDYKEVDEDEEEEEVEEEQRKTTTDEDEETKSQIEEELQNSKTTNPEEEEEEGGGGKGEIEEEY